MDQKELALHVINQIKDIMRHEDRNIKSFEKLLYFSGALAFLVLKKGEQNVSGDETGSIFS